MCHLRAVTGAGAERDAQTVELPEERLTWEIEGRFLEEGRPGQGHKAVNVGWPQRQRTGPSKDPDV